MLHWRHARRLHLDKAQICFYDLINCILPFWGYWRQTGPAPEISYWDAWRQGFKSLLLIGFHDGITGKTSHLQDKMQHFALFKYLKFNSTTHLILRNLKWFSAFWCEHKSFPACDLQALDIIFTLATNSDKGFPVWPCPAMPVSNQHWLQKSLPFEQGQINPALGLRQTHTDVAYS